MSVLTRSKFMVAILAFVVSTASPIWADPPTVVVSIKSIDELLDDANFIAGVAGQEGVRDLAEQSIKDMTGGAGLAGIDRDRLLGLYWNMNEAEPDGAGTLVAFVPISDQGEFVELIKKFIPDLKEEDGQYSVSLGGQNLFAVFHENYCFISTTAEGIAEPESPDEIVSSDDDISIAVNISSIPRSLRDNYLSIVEQGARSSIENEPKPETEVEIHFRNLGVNWVLAAVSAITTDGEQLSFGIDIDSEAQSVSLDLGLTAVEKTPLAKTFAGYAKTTPAFGAVSSDDAPLRLVLSHPTTAIAADLDQSFSLLRKAADAEIDKDPKMKDDADRKAAKDVATRLFNIAESTLKSGSLHSVLVVEDGDDDTVRILGGTKVANGNEAGKLLDDILKLAKESPDFAQVKPDVAKHAGARIHEIDGDKNDKTSALFGEGPGHLAIRTDSLWFALGGGNLEALKQSLDQSGKKPAKTQVPISLRVKPATMVTLMEKDNQALVERAEAIAGEDGDRLDLQILPQDQNGIKIQLSFGTELFKLGAN